MNINFTKINYDDRSMQFYNVSFDATQEAIAFTEIEREPGDTRRFERAHGVFLYREVSRFHFKDALQTISVFIVVEKIISSGFRHWDMYN